MLKVIDKNAKRWSLEMVNNPLLFNLAYALEVQQCSNLKDRRLNKLQVPSFTPYVSQSLWVRSACR